MVNNFQQVYQNHSMGKRQCFQQIVMAKLNSPCKRMNVDFILYHIYKNNHNVD